MERFSLEVKVGLVVTAAVGLVIAFIFILGDWNPFTNTYRLTVTLNYAGGIKPGSDVHLAGAKVGKVDSIRFLPSADPSAHEPVLGLELLIDKRAKDLIREDSLFAIRMESLLGGKIVEISPGSPDRPVLEEGAEVRGEDPPQLEDLINEAVALLEGVKGIMDQFGPEDRERVSKLLVSLSQFGPDDVTRVKDTIRNASEATADLSEITAEVKPEIGPLMDDVRTTMSRVDPAIRDARNLMRRLDSTVADVREMAPEDVEAARDSVDRLLAAAEDLARVADRLDRFTAMLEDEYGEMDGRDVERIIRQFLQQEGVTINVGKIVGEPDYPPPPEKEPETGAEDGNDLQ